jgi:hypothetical protein
MSADKQLPDELAKFEAEISKATDSIYGTLIAHLYVEHLLDRYLKTKIPNEAKLFGERGLSFTNKLKLVKGFGEFESQLIDSLSKLNSIRNDCAHVFGHQISDDKVEALGRTLGKDYKRILTKYPKAEVGAIAPIVWNICGRMLHATLEAEKKK